MRGFGESNKSKKKNIPKLQPKYDDNQILNKAINYHYQGDIFQASKLYKFLIDKGSHNGTVFTNYGLIIQMYYQELFLLLLQQELLIIQLN